MRDTLYLAWRYLAYNRFKTAILVLSIMLIVYLPIGLNVLVDQSADELTSRAETTPLLVGARGSPLELVLNSLYFGADVPETIPFAEVTRIADGGLARPIPLYVRFRVRDDAIVGTTLDYFDFRGLEIADGEQLAVLGDCVLGATVADRLDLKVGDSIVSSPENLFDLAGVYPLKMKIVGVLEKSHTSDDLAVFVDLKTTYIIQGLVHGHTDLWKVTDPTLILKKEDKNIAGSPKVYEYTEITEDNIEEFHYHGDPSTAPITAVIAVPFDEKSGTILRGRFLGAEEAYQIVKPEEVIDTLLANIFRIKNVLDAVIVVVGLGTVIAIILIFALSLRLRQREIETIFKIGCRRMTIARLIASEIAIIVAFSAIVCLALLAVVSQYDDSLVRTLFIR